MICGDVERLKYVVVGEIQYKDFTQAHVNLKFDSMAKLRK
jgi:hypothetical protein